MQPNTDPTHNLTSAFLFLRTASTAVTNLTTQIESTKAYIQHTTQNGQLREHNVYEARLETELQDLTSWEARLAQASVEVVNWAAKVRTGQWLPGEILGMIEERLRGDHLVMPDIW